MPETIEMDFAGGMLGYWDLSKALARARCVPGAQVDILLRRVDPRKIPSFVDAAAIQAQIEEGVRNTFLSLDIPGQVKAAVLEAMEQARLNS